MNGDADQNELARLKDEEVELLYEICKRASLLDAPPYKALFEAYSQVLAENGRALEHDATIFRVLIPIGRETRSAGLPIDPLTSFKRLLVVNNISVIDDNEEEYSRGALSDTHEWRDTELNVGIAPVANGLTEEHKVDKRRVSFDDARLEETWLLENELDLEASHEGLLRLAPRRPRPSGQPRRASLSSHHDLSLHTQPSFSRHPTTTAPLQPALLLDPSRANLESDADTFAYTSDLRLARRCLEVWHTAMLSRSGDRIHLELIATESYQKALLKAVLDAWRERLALVREKELQRIRIEGMETCAEATYRRSVLVKKLVKWKQSSDWQLEATAQAWQNLLVIRYFQRWKAITEMNLRKSRAILTRKVLVVWQDQVARRRLRVEQAETFQGIWKVRNAYRSWCRQYLERKVLFWRKERAKLRLDTWRTALLRYDERNDVAIDHYAYRAKASGISTLRQRLGSARQIQESLRPLAANLSIRVQTDLQRKSLNLMLLRSTSLRQAATFDHRRVLQTAWSTWNDSLRCQVLAQKTNERILVENLYRWVLEERCRLFRHSKDHRVAQYVLSVWSGSLKQMQITLTDAERVFAERQYRRRIASSMGHLHGKVRQQENAERYAVEFSNRRVMPSVLAPWSKQMYHVRTLQRWATDSRFFNLTSKNIKLWRDNTEKHKTERRRQAYSQIRARIKIRIARACLACMHERSVHLYALLEQAYSVSRTKLSLRGSASLTIWRQSANRIGNMKQTAASLNHQRLIGSSFAALSLRLDSHDALEFQAEEARREANLDLLGGTLKKMQWISFSVAQHAARRNESAEALWVRNRDTHVKRMIRVWHTQATTHVTRRALQTNDHGGREPESPSLRQASRAASRSVQQTGPQPPAVREMTTPAYLRTPSRSRKAGRFRMLLPTPVPLTPFHFDAADVRKSSDLLDNDQIQVDQQKDYASSLRPDADALALPEQHASTPHVTAFVRKLRAGGFSAPGPDTTPYAVPSALRNRVIDPIAGTATTTTKNVRFLSASKTAKASRLGGRTETGEQNMM